MERRSLKSFGACGGDGGGYEAPRLPKKMPRPAPPPPPLPPPPKNLSYEVELSKTIITTNNVKCKKQSDAVKSMPVAPVVNVLKVNNNLLAEGGKQCFVGDNGGGGMVTLLGRRAKKRAFALGLGLVCFLVGVACVLLVKYLTSDADQGRLLRSSSVSSSGLEDFRTFYSLARPMRQSAREPTTRCER